MEKSIVAKRKAQKLARDGQVQAAIDEMRHLLEESEADPYDHVYLGDLLMRRGEQGEAVACYQAAVRSYESVGLIRNAIAVGKKVLRIDSAQHGLHRTLGELYDREGLSGEAMPHYLSYLDSFHDNDLPPDEFFEVLDRAACVSGQQLEVALRLADHFARLRRSDRAAALLEEVAARAEASGSADVALEVRARAAALRGGPLRVETPSIPEIDAAPDAGGSEFDFAFGMSEPPPLRKPVEPVAPIQLDLTTLDWSRPSPSAEDAPASQSTAQPTAQPTARPTIEPTIEQAAEVRPESSAPDSSEEVTLRARADHAASMGLWNEARALYVSCLRSSPTDCDLLDRMVDVATQQRDVAGIAHYLVLLGDCWIEAGELARAADCFGRVIEVDPENATAKRRLQRFQEMGLKAPVDSRVDGGGETRPAPLAGVLDSGDALVSVKDAEARGDEWIDLEGLLEEFKAGLKNHMDASDYQGHYDLALSHHQMGLLEDAIEELDQVLDCAELPASMVQPARELRGLCLMGLSRFREAVHEFRDALEKADSGALGTKTALYHLARALESVEEWEEARERYDQLLTLAPGFQDSEERRALCRERAA